jgi:16S rRNA (uracil1498-N3)-methyltransferase
VHRFFVPQSLSAGLTQLPQTVSHHITVLRLRSGDSVQLFNHDCAWNGSLVTLGNTATVNLCEPLSPAQLDAMELPFPITVVQSLIEPSKMDWVIEKAVELGVNQVIPMAAMRSVTRLDEQRAAKRLAHWQAIAVAASQQCGRQRIMRIHSPCTATAVLSSTAGGLHVLLHPKDGQSLQHWCHHTPAGPVTIWVGPEGGWAPAELEQLEQAGAKRVSFGTRILRTETAAVAIAAALQALWT